MRTRCRDPGERSRWGKKWVFGPIGVKFGWNSFRYATFAAFLLVVAGSIVVETLWGKLGGKAGILRPRAARGKVLSPRKKENPAVGVAAGWCESQGRRKARKEKPRIVGPG